MYGIRAKHIVHQVHYEICRSLANDTNRSRIWPCYSQAKLLFYLDSLQLLPLLHTVLVEHSLFNPFSKINFSELSDCQLHF